MFSNQRSLLASTYKLTACELYNLEQAMFPGVRKSDTESLSSAEVLAWKTRVEQESLFLNFVSNNIAGITS